MPRSKKETAAKQYILPEGLIRLHVSLNGVDNEYSEILKEYGNVCRGRTITRDIIVPEDMPLSALHYVIQRAFGFQDSHQHMFQTYGEAMIKVCDDNMGNFLNLRGVIFHEDLEEDEVLMNYPLFFGGNFFAWMRKQYTGPYEYEGDYLEDYFLQDEEEEFPEDDYEKSRRCMPDDLYYIVEKVNPSGKDDRNARAIVEADIIDSIEEPGEHVKLEERQYWYCPVPVRCAADDPDVCTVRKVRLGDLSLFDGFEALQAGINQLIERLKISDILAVSEDRLPLDEMGNVLNPVIGLKFPQIVTSEQIQDAIEADEGIDPSPFTDVLIYTYDFGDSWRFTIIGSRGCTDLIEQKAVTLAQAEKAAGKVLKMHRPVLLAADGDMLIEDIGNVEGFADFLKHVRLDPKTVVAEQEGILEGDNYTVDWEAMEDDDDVDDNGMTRAESLEWAVSQGWHRNDYTNYSLL